MTLNPDLLLSALGIAISLWSLAVTLVASRANVARRDIALAGSAGALALLLLAEGRRLRNKKTARREPASTR